MNAAKKLKSESDLLAFGEEARAELVNGELVSIETSGEHSDAQAGINRLILPIFHRRGGSDGGGGGWWIYTEATVAFSFQDILRPDIAGWRRERVPERPIGFPIRELPDWVCEVLSPSTARRDLIEKRAIYHRAHVSHYWVVDLEKETLTVLRWSPAGYVIVLVAGPEDSVRAEPFEALELWCGGFFGRERDE